MLKILKLILIIAFCSILFNDIDKYYHSVNNNGYNGLVERFKLKRPFTYMMVDEWTGGEWTWNPTKTERWFVSYGLINGKTEFFIIIDSHIPKI
jgi:hypothetical protein